ncbi:GIY-YIG nuclease family protein [Mycoplasma sp. 744]|uniref:GIY-YIG nuclease family protein n=1 Tax=Mycoplasma sp. 744 TaxID=3108531 RepID=UPI002B1DC0A5|nr:GIY-YIG nuclease family protein [Mycoplasma sp. 744]MEA4115590.1 GIY-YIG nuclease family protein [Mycoplasma sp. 744]
MFDKNKLNNVKNLPGVYLWKNKNDDVIYVGKAKKLQNRMKQYFEGSINSFKTNKMVNDISDYQIFIVSNDKEALLLERKLIERYKPEYNILLQDDKYYPYIEISYKNTEIKISRLNKHKIQKKPNSLYLGPFPNGYGASKILKLIEREAFYTNGLKIENNDPLFWKQKFLNLKKILNFSNEDYLKKLKQEMHSAAEKWNFEIAKDLKESIEYLEKLKEKQVIELKNQKDLDVISYKVVDDLIFLNILFYRHGILMDSDRIVLKSNLNVKFFFEEFLDHYYFNKLVPDLILVDKELLNLDLDIDLNIYKLTSDNTKIYKQLLNLAYLNLNVFIEKELLNYKFKINKTINNLKSFSELIGLENLKDIVLFDNSNLNNSNPIGVAIVYTNGVKNKSGYRKFNHGLNLTRKADVEYMELTAEKYFSNLEKNIFPSLIIVDGGMAQLNSVKKIMKKHNLNLKIIALVKDDNHKTKGLIDLNENLILINSIDSNLRNFLSEMQLEVDRFAKEHLRNRLRIISTQGKLQTIKGLGPKMETNLLNYFHNYANIFNAPYEELIKVVPKNIAKKIFDKDYLNNEN